ncbi:MAG TPA: tail fiber domain-containing protein [Pyrinomonadaceae bacterium]|nr:tail fiber domain-containing protein [Chloracidobacterium sp.]MBP9936238.1 tail fiber domain-containing protein [Pyrinomonadaceae bacterium]MBK9437073.1 tail fiber domain-containing protein [Chloracidobacterium sp.]MBL0239746.1 tail fiber domain-containing protein [Chloracidobacterium sp.]HQX56157.1 tail fiber domain-containing protein [Pyrinomonadaceae bacterium]
MDSKTYRQLVSTMLFLFFTSAAISAQTTEFNYQGTLKDGANVANGNFDFEFRIFDDVSAGTQIGSLLTRANVVVANGIFSVKLDFANPFNGADRFLEIRVRNAGGTGYTVLDPRQRIGSSPYAVKSLLAETANNANSAATANNALQLGGVAANQYVVTTDPRMTDPRTPTAGSANYVQNTTSQQAATNLNISGNGIVGGILSGNVVNATSHYNIGGIRVLSNPGSGNIFAGVGAGTVNSGGINNSFVGASAGQANTTGLDNSFFGRSAGASNTTGGGNSFFGTLAGGANTTGGGNSFFGTNAGNLNTTGTNNSFVGIYAGQLNTTAGNNSFFGGNAGASNTAGFGNSFFGAYAGQANTAGLSNTFVGSNAGYANSTGGNNSYFGVLAGGSSTSGGGNTFVGTNAGDSNTTGSGNSFIGTYAGTTNKTGSNNTLVGNYSDVASNALSFATAIGSESYASLSNSVYLGRPGGEDTVRIPGSLNITGATAMNGNLIFASGNTALFQSPITVTSLGSAGSTAVCRNASNQLSTCSSSLRYKTNIIRFGFGLDLVRRLSPITFDWKDGGMHDLGLGAEDVAAIEPLLVTYNAKGEVEGVKYDRIGVVLVNAVKEQQEQINSQKTEITAQRTMIERQQREIELLKAYVCSMSPTALVCHPSK